MIRKEPVNISTGQEYPLDGSVTRDEKAFETFRNQNEIIPNQDNENMIGEDRRLMISGDRENGNRESSVPEASGMQEVVKGGIRQVWVGRKKEKSALSLLCEDFLFKFGHMNEDGSPSHFKLQIVAAHCNVPRRRMYDVINVLESIGVVKRTAKLKYIFHGYDQIPDVLTNIVRTEEESNKSVGHLTRKMIRVLLQHNGTMPTSHLAAKLIGPDVAPEPIKKQRSQRQITIERRLYDIASVLTSIGLLERVQQQKRVPTIVWTYGWMPGSSHDPPVLSVARMALEPHPSLEPLTDEQIGKSQRKRKAAALEKTAESPKYTPPSHFQGTNFMSGNYMDEDAFSKMIAATPMLQSFSHASPGLLPGMESQDPLAGLDPSALAALLAAQQNMPTTGHQASPGIISGEIPPEIMMQFQKYGLFYPYMVQCQPVQQSNTDGSHLSPAGEMNESNRM